MQTNGGYIYQVTSSESFPFAATCPEKESARNWIVLVVQWSVIFCSEFPDIPNKAGRKTRRIRRTQAIAKRYAFHANAIN